MTGLKFALDWLEPPDGAGHPNTMANLALHVGTINLMQNEDIWSRTVKESVLVSAYPLAMWLASSWWRLNWEPCPPTRPDVDWRMAHEMGAANEGFVWPKILFASDLDVMQVWAEPSKAASQQSVRYLNGLDSPVSIRLQDFQQAVDGFIALVLERLDVCSCQGTDLANLWQLIQEERADPDNSLYCRLEAKLGYDPGECPEELMDKALTLGQKMGEAALFELTPVYGKSAAIDDIGDMIAGPGLSGAPTAPLVKASPNLQREPWQRAVAAAQDLRQAIGKSVDDVIGNHELYGLLGLTATAVEQWAPAKHNNAAIAIPGPNNQFKFIPRKQNSMGKRFELARFLGDYLLTAGQWLASTDAKTSRQKYQRAFAAEFLCPIVALQAFLQDDCSESAIEGAAEHFNVSERTVMSLLVNNGVLPSHLFFDYQAQRMPYRLGF